MRRTGRYDLWDGPIGDPFGGPAYGKREDPITAIQVVSGVIGAFSAISQGNAAKKAADYNAAIGMQNAQIARDDAAAQATQLDRENYLRLGSIRASQGKAGGAANEGSVLDVLGDQAAQGELEKQYTIYQGEQRARGFTNTAQLDTFSGQTAQTGGYLKAGSELLSGSAKAYTSYNRLSRV